MMRLTANVWTWKNPKKKKSKDILQPRGIFEQVPLLFFERGMNNESEEFCKEF